MKAIKPEMNLMRKRQPVRGRDRGKEEVLRAPQGKTRLRNLKT